mgnify:CR=1 FL=1
MAEHEVLDRPNRKETKLAAVDPVHMASAIAGATVTILRREEGGRLTLVTTLVDVADDGRFRAEGLFPTAAHLNDLGKLERARGENERAVITNVLAVRGHQASTRVGAPLRTVSF